MWYKDYIDTYFKETEEIIARINRAEIGRAIKMLKELRDRKGRLFIIGVGGSAANSSHAVNDFRKMCQIEAYAPVDNVAELTAWTNDEGFEHIFQKWLKVSRLSSKDALMVFSVGGGSATVSRNIVLALDYAQEIGAKIIGVVSRDGGATKKSADITILIPVVHERRVTPHAEAWQGVVWHLLANALMDNHPVEPLA